MPFCHTFPGIPHDSPVVCVRNRHAKCVCFVRWHETCSRILSLRLAFGCLINELLETDSKKRDGGAKSKIRANRSKIANRVSNPLESLFPLSL